MATRLPTAQAAVVRGMPPALQSSVRAILAEPQPQEAVKAMLDRVGDFRSPMSALLSGLAMDETGRAMVSAMIDALPLDPDAFYPSNGYGERRAGFAQEIIIGAGLHAAIYASVRRAQGKPAPVILAGQGRLGGVFATSANPSFYLNSRNRPGDLSLPGRATGALNVLPGSPIQPSDLSGDEYQPNDALSFVIRLALAMSGATIVRESARSTLSADGRVLVECASGNILADRVIVATGLNEQRKVNGETFDGETVLTFGDLMARADRRFPLQGLNRVAVIGAGDSGKTAVELLTGQGPSSGWSTAGLDWPSEIDWYGVPQLTREEWERCNRSRYKGIGRLFPRDSSDRTRRVNPIYARAESVSNGYGCAYVGERAYDAVIVCAGQKVKRPDTGGRLWVDYADAAGGRYLGRKLPGLPVYAIGPAAELPLTPAESEYAGITENGTAMFRYASRTAALAAELPGIPTGGIGLSD